MQKDIEELGESINNAFDQRNVQMLAKCIADGALIDSSVQDAPDERMTLYSYLGNAWSELDTLRHYGKTEIWSYSREEHINAIKYYRKCVAVASPSLEYSVNIGIQAFTNLGNMFSSSGRVVFAIEAWKKALQIIPDFGMAGGNLAHGLLHYARSMYDDGHKALVLRHCHKILKYHIAL